MGCCGSKEQPAARTAPAATSYAPPPKEPAVQASSSSAAPPVSATRPISTKAAVQARGSHGSEAVNRVRGQVEEKYTVGKELGRGGFSLVKEGINKQTGEKVAIKFIEKKIINKQELELLEREIKIMEKVKHKYVLRLYEIFETDTMLALIMEFVNGGELFYKIVDRGMYTEKEAKGIVRQLVEGVNYLHSQGVVHRDLKPENLLCSETAEGMEIKIADFGLSKFAVDGLGTSCGTPDYAAPEVLRMDGDYQQSVDLWSVGVITYVILCGFPPFYGNPQSKLFEKILNADYDFPDPEWTHISNEAKDFIRKLLVLDEDARATAEQCENHPWLKTNAGNSNAPINLAKLKDYNANRPLAQN